MDKNKLKLIIAVVLLLAAGAVVAYQFWPESRPAPTDDAGAGATPPAPVSPSDPRPQRRGGSRLAPQAPGAK